MGRDEEGAETFFSKDSSRLLLQSPPSPIPWRLQSVAVSVLAPPSEESGTECKEDTEEAATRL